MVEFTEDERARVALDERIREAVRIEMAQSWDGAHERVELDESWRSDVRAELRSEKTLLRFVLGSIFAAISAALLIEALPHAVSVNVNRAMLGGSAVFFIWALMSLKD